MIENTLAQILTAALMALNYLSKGYYYYPSMLIVLTIQHFVMKPCCIIFATEIFHPFCEEMVTNDSDYQVSGGMCP